MADVPRFNEPEKDVPAVNTTKIGKLTEAMAMLHSSSSPGWDWGGALSSFRDENASAVEGDINVGDDVMLVYEGLESSTGATFARVMHIVRETKLVTVMLHESGEVVDTTLADISKDPAKGATVIVSMLHDSGVDVTSWLCARSVSVKYNQDGPIGVPLTIFDTSGMSGVEQNKWGSKLILLEKLLHRDQPLNDLNLVTVMHANSVYAFSAIILCGVVQLDEAGNRRERGYLAVKAHSRGRRRQQRWTEFMKSSFISPATQKKDGQVATYKYVLSEESPLFVLWPQRPGISALKHSVLPIMPGQQSMNNLERLVDVYGPMIFLEKILAHCPLFMYLREEGVFPSGKMLEFLASGSLTTGAAASSSSAPLEVVSENHLLARAEMACVRHIAATVAHGIDVQYSKLGGEASAMSKHAALSEYARRMTTVRTLLRALGLVRRISDTLEHVIIDFLPKMLIVPAVDVPVGQRKRDSVIRPAVCH